MARDRGRGAVEGVVAADAVEALERDLGAARVVDGEALGVAVARRRGRLPSTPRRRPRRVSFAALERAVRPALEGARGKAALVGDRSRSSVPSG